MTCACHGYASLQNTSGMAKGQLLKSMASQQTFVYQNHFDWM